MSCSYGISKSKRISRLPTRASNESVAAGQGLPEIMQLLRSSPRNAHIVRSTPTDTVIRNHQQNFVIATTDLFENDILVNGGKIPLILGLSSGTRITVNHGFSKQKCPIRPKRCKPNTLLPAAKPPRDILAAVLRITCSNKTVIPTKFDAL